MDTELIDRNDKKLNVGIKLDAMQYYSQRHIIETPIDAPRCAIKVQIYNI